MWIDNPYRSPYESMGLQKSFSEYPGPYQSENDFGVGHLGGCVCSLSISAAEKDPFSNDGDILGYCLCWNVCFHDYQSFMYRSVYHPMGKQASRETTVKSDQRIHRQEISR